MPQPAVRFAGRDRRLSFANNRDRMLGEYFGSVEAMRSLLRAKPMTTTRLILLVAIGEIGRADLAGGPSSLAVLVREKFANVEATPREVTDAVAKALATL